MFVIGTEAFELMTGLEETAQKTSPAVVKTACFQSGMRWHGVCNNF